MHLRVGARGSDLSLAQTRWLIAQLQAAHPTLDIELVIIETHGDRDQTSALDMLWPPGGFVKEIERALLAGDIDVAVHSFKDVPTEPVDGLTIAATPVRESPGDVLLSRQPLTLDAIPPGFTVGTCSARRSLQIRRHAPGVQIQSIRGNVPTRISKLREGLYDGIILAAAGLARLGIHSLRDTHSVHAVALPLESFLPAPAQGALAAQTRIDGKPRELVSALNHAPTRSAVDAERAFLRTIGGGCHAALGALGTVNAGTLHLRGELFIDEQPFSAEVQGPASEADTLGSKLADLIQRQQ